MNNVLQNIDEERNFLRIKNKEITKEYLSLLF